MLPDRVSNPGPLTYESGALPIALRGPAHGLKSKQDFIKAVPLKNWVRNLEVNPYTLRDTYVIHTFLH